VSDENNTFTPEFSTFYLIPELQRWEGFIQIFFLSPTALWFTQPNEDPWFNASTALGSFYLVTDGSIGHNVTLYSASEPASPLGCPSQEQICNPSFARTLQTMHKPDKATHCRCRSNRPWSLSPGLQIRSTLGMGL
jgi:hypothetical protein